MIDRTVHWVGSAVIKENYLYCVYRRYNLLIRIDLISWKYERIAALKWDRNNLVTGVYEIDDQIICVPLNGIQIAVYNIKSREIRYFLAENPEMELIDVTVCERKIWLFPRNLTEKLYYFSLENENFYEEYTWENEVERLKVQGRIKKKCFISHNEIYMVVAKRIVKYDLITHFMTEINMPLNGSYQDVVKNGRRYYVLMEKNNRTIFCWNEEENKISEICEKKKNGYIKLTKVGTAVLMDSGNDIEILNDGLVKKIRLLKNTNLKSSGYISSVRFGDRWILLPWGNTDFADCALDFSNVNMHEVKISIKDIFWGQTFFVEEELTLNTYIEGVSSREERVANEEKANEVGWSIYELSKK